MAIQEPSSNLNETETLADDLSQLSGELIGVASLLRYMQEVHQADTPMLVDALCALNAQLNQHADQAALAAEQARTLLARLKVGHGQ